ncbi:MAG: Anucleate primary sterigmata protein B [Thelocarpon impressellum]|nr:MAG: Anucleate primary sterigmata protein B [Thelocarpon impressellum]
MTPPPPPDTQEDFRPHAALPGDFAGDAASSPLKDPDAAGRDALADVTFDQSDSFSLPPLPPDDSDLLHAPSDDGDSRDEHEIDDVREGEMRRRLMDIESSFMPGHSPLLHPGGGEDVSMLGPPRPAMAPPPHPSTYKQMSFPDAPSHADPTTLPEEPVLPPSPPTPPESYRTPAPPDDGSSWGRDDGALDVNTSSLETMSSSPTAAAAARTVSRVVSLASAGGYHSAEDHSPERPLHTPTAEDEEATADGEKTPRKAKDLASTDPVGSADRPELQALRQRASQVVAPESDTRPGASSGRPKILRSRFASQRSSASSFTTVSSKDGASDVTLGVNLPGGSGPGDDHSGRNELSRSTSLGSIASGVTGFEESASSWDRGRTVSSTSIVAGPMAGSADRNLAPLDEEREGQYDPTSASASSDPKTPRGPGRNLTAPTDTVIAQHVRDVQVPASVAREFRQNNRPGSPEKRAGMPVPPSARGKGMTLKEQSSSIDRLQKENFDLKLKIHYLNQALNERSEEGVKEMISENVELKAGLATMEKQARNLRKTIRDLERAQKEREAGSAEEGAEGGAGKDEAQEADAEAMLEMEEEISFLRERVETYEYEIEKMRTEDVAREGEKRRLAEIVRSMGERKGADVDVGAREEMDMWKDLLEAETARREQADDDNRKLRDEIWRLKNEGSSTTTNNHSRNVYHVNKRQHAPSGSRSGGSSQTEERNGAISAASTTLVEQLRHENEELRREVGAQTSMLTSRNREKERLYQEIEDLKLGHIRGDGMRSVAGDSIFERSASRAHERTASRASVGTRVTVLSDGEREEYENRNGQLRDQISTLKLTNQELERQLEGCLDDLDKADVAKSDFERASTEYVGEIDLLTQDLQTMQAERDEALTLREELEAQFESLRNEAQQEINTLEGELDQKGDDVQRLEAELESREENFRALQAEMRSMSEGVVRLEDDQQANARKVQSLQRELQDTVKELEGLEKDLREANGKIERFTVQQESSQGEIAFLREEQDGDKIKIGDLETALKTAESSVQDEKERCRELDKRLADERHQREVVGGKEKQEVQRIMNELNREAASARDEARRLRKSLSAREVEATEWKERLIELENNLREALGDLSGTRSSLLTSVTKLQRELEETAAELDVTRERLAEKDRVLKHRDALLENMGLESRRLSDLLDRERQARKADRYQFENLQKTSQHTSYTLSQQETRVRELESSRSVDRKKLATLETQLTDRLLERNQLLLTLWNRLSTLCGPDWAHKNTLVNGRLPSVEVIASMLPGFGKNLLAAVKSIEGLVNGFKVKIKGAEKELWKQYQTLEHSLEVRSKKLERLEAVVHNRRTTPTAASSELAKLRGENRLLKAEMTILQRAESESRQPPGTVPVRDVNRGALSRHRSTSTAESFERLGSAGSDGLLEDDPTEQRWVHRLRELERRLKAEREARLLDRNGARKRLEEGKAENEELRLELEREKVRKAE